VQPVQQHAIQKQLWSHDYHMGAETDLKQPRRRALNESVLLLLISFALHALMIIQGLEWSQSSIDFCDYGYKES
jgi:hypothetical protein